ncbi:MAG: polysaccharide pyruvyl transferase family protein [bacterium]|nr:polysaccharide pyruvyl transferase family protein [bacterium]
MENLEQSIRIGISGSYGGLNLGDEAILQSMIYQIRGTLSAQITVFTRNAEDTKMRHDADRVVEIRSLAKEEAARQIEQLDVFVLGGGGILFDGEVENFLREVVLAQELNIPTMIYAVSAGPLDRPSSRKLVRETLSKASCITVRDRQGKQLLEEIGVEGEIIITADPALLLKGDVLPIDTLKREGLEMLQPLVGFSVREPGLAAPDIDAAHYHNVIANSADFMVRRFGAHIVFVPMERRVMDMQQSHAVVAKMHCAQYAHVLKGEYSPSQLISLFGHFEFAVGMRLHFLILASLASVPFVPLPYASKVRGFIEQMGLEMPPLNDVNAGELIAHIDQAWDLRKNLRAHVQKKLPDIQQRAGQTHQVLVDLIRRSARENAERQFTAPLASSSTSSN